MYACTVAPIGQPARFYRNVTSVTRRARPTDRVLALDRLFLKLRDRLVQALEEGVYVDPVRHRALL